MNVVVEKPNALHVQLNSKDSSFRKFHHWFKDAIFKHIPSKEGRNAASIGLNAGGDEKNEVRREGEEFTMDVFMRSMHFLDINSIMFITKPSEKV